MKKQKTVALILAVVFVLALFAGCGGKTGTADSSAAVTSSSTTTSGGTVTATPTEKPSPYNYAAGKYEKNAEGFPKEKYVYNLPLTTLGETFTKWTTCYTPQYIPEDGWGSIETWKGVREKTGVNIEYDIVASNSRSQNFSVLLASDALEDIMDQAMYMYASTGTPRKAIDEGYFVNLVDYRDYMPCYMYETYVRSQGNPNVMSTVFYDKDTMASMAGMLVEPAPGTGLVVRQDWMDTLGLGKAIDITTYDELTKVLTAFKTADSTRYPLWIYNSIEVGSYTFSGFNTMMWSTNLNYRRVVDGKVQFCGTTDDDKDAMTLLNSWFTQGFIDPNFSAHTTTFDSSPITANNIVGVMPVPPSAVVTMEKNCKDPKVRWDPIPTTKKTDNQILQYGHQPGNFHYGSASVSTKCENVELAVTWLDWWMSDEGSDWTSWGPEGLMWEYNSSGKRQLTDYVLNHPAGMAWAMCLYGCNGLVEFCLQVHKRNYAYPGGERFLQDFDVWTVKDYGGKYDFPTGVRLTDDQSKEATSLMADLNTYFSENYNMFVDGSKPMSEWKAFQDGLQGFGLGRATEIYQDAYDTFMANQVG